MSPTAGMNSGIKGFSLVGRVNFLGLKRVMCLKRSLISLSTGREEKSLGL